MCPIPISLTTAAMGANTDEYCNICNPFQYDTSIMANAAVRTAHIQDTANLYSDIQDGTLPAVSFVKPSGLVDGHPASSKLEPVRRLHAEDRGRGSGQPDSLERNGDPDHLRRRRRLLRLGLCSAARLLRRRHAHSADRRVSLHAGRDTSRTTIRITFPSSNSSRGTGILGPVTSRSRDNFPNPIMSPANPYVPDNTSGDQRPVRAVQLRSQLALIAEAVANNRPLRSLLKSTR